MNLTRTCGLVPLLLRDVAKVIADPRLPRVRRRGGGGGGVSRDLNDASAVPFRVVLAVARLPAIAKGDAWVRPE